MALPVQTPSIDRGFVGRVHSGGINPSSCSCQFSCNGKSYDEATTDCIQCNTVANMQCKGAMPVCTCPTGGGI